MAVYNTSARAQVVMASAVRQTLTPIAGAHSTQMRQAASRQAKSSTYQLPRRQLDRNTSTAAAPAPEPASPFLCDNTDPQGLIADRVEAGALLAGMPRPGSTPKQGYTWLDHPFPSNPFRTRMDESAWYVPPTPQQRQLAHDLGLPLDGY